MYDIDTVIAGEVQERASTIDAPARTMPTVPSDTPEKIVGSLRTTLDSILRRNGLWTELPAVIPEANGKFVKFVALTVKWQSGIVLWAEMQAFNSMSMSL